ncbi:accessory gene regulator AgrB [Staphylococcus epidermidis]|uniref:accessory gene regulator AgrB n=1 Tax=Staphylococcus epidermidis TaxID=1282 RepID=UPI0021A7159F|nr:accessory gene regulator AgrB [Staphylococcus epidermidis]MCT1350943.1 accessory gene regulator AgrB [Staphylococcus epidermidis]MCT1543481.1 accessory gene regulator AgrB [Staphylococcus epidermidis]MCT1609418.1 accessory gene regulator AgrB [Staphylococcus epidermidis]MCT1661951.1 accessory gene regulator AgrB [Staphylococcus epidermidis]MCT1672888.1 accessory gene regulator AgrB [Staphylococcus epidermidis]
MKIIDKKIEQFAQYLQRKNNLDHIQFLKVRLGMQVVVGNIEKTVVLYGLSYFFDLLIFTFLTHISYFLLRIFAHGAHAKTSLQCHIQNILYFIFIPWLVLHFSLGTNIFYFLAIISFLLVISFAPAATKKQPIPKHLLKKKKVLSILSFIIIITIALTLEEVFKKNVISGVVIESITLLPIFFPKED